LPGYAPHCWTTKEIKMGVVLDQNVAILAYFKIPFTELKKVAPNKSNLRKPQFYLVLPHLTIP